MTARIVGVVSFVVLSIACRAPTDPVLRDIDLAHTRWLATAPAEYRVDMAIETSWFPQSEFHRAFVVDGTIVLVVNEAGAVVAESWVISLDSLWTRILGEREKGTLDRAEFTREGVPLVADWGLWAADGGVRYTVRSFARLP